MQPLMLGLAAALLLAAPAFAEPGSGAAYRVVEEGVSIPASRPINAHEIVDADTILLRTGANRWYAADVSGDCLDDVQQDDVMNFAANGSSRFDARSEIVIDGKRCQVTALSRVDRSWEMHGEDW